MFNFEPRNFSSSVKCPKSQKKKVKLILEIAEVEKSEKNTAMPEINMTLKPKLKMTKK